MTHRAQLDSMTACEPHSSCTGRRHRPSPSQIVPPRPQWVRAPALLPAAPRQGRPLVGWADPRSADIVRRESRHAPIVELDVATSAKRLKNAFGLIGAATVDHAAAAQATERVRYFLGYRGHDVRTRLMRFARQIQTTTRSRISHSAQRGRAGSLEPSAANQRTRLRPSKTVHQFRRYRSYGLATMRSAFVTRR